MFLWSQIRQKNLNFQIRLQHWGSINTIIILAQFHHIIKKMQGTRVTSAVYALYVAPLRQLQHIARFNFTFISRSFEIFFVGSLISWEKLIEITPHVKNLYYSQLLLFRAIAWIKKINDYNSFNAIKSCGILF